ncbi:hypothetical protein MiAbW_02304 [Microcystis aeruginosa NIES-4325]|uniref:Uncharacterized protein n=1 Tax=Microcystis aeruginosa NIES-4325 TaxID=2569534 RepID=A0A5J4F9I9_MICAE|nr:hypothetical protein MiAbW_02304 [Microcystis aeruginosa NIES-4325]
MLKIVRHPPRLLSEAEYNVALYGDSLVKEVENYNLNAW